MRHVALSVVLCWCVLPAFASIQVKAHDPAYKVMPVSGMSGMRVDWTQRAIFITGVAVGPRNTSVLNARNAARNTALAGVRKQTDVLLNDFRITGYATIADLLTTRILPPPPLPSLPAAVRPVVEIWDDAKRELTLACVLPMSGPGTPGELAARLLEFEQKALDTAPRTYPVNEMTLVKTVATNQLSAGPYTGVIFDATGLGVTPVLLPKFLAQDGNEVWGTRGVSPQLVLEKGIAIYADSLKTAVASGRVGANPLVIRPIGTFGKTHSDLVLSPEDITLLQEQDGLSRFLPTLSVAIVIDQR